MLFEFTEPANQRAKLKVVGVGGAGGNALTRMVQGSLTGVEFISINTDAQDLEHCECETKIQIGRNMTKGLGAGANMELGRRAIEEDRDAVAGALTDADMVFVTAGMGGGTGTGAAPVVAEIARDLGALTIGIVTKPFAFEAPKRMRRAEGGLHEMKKTVDTLIVIPNQRLLDVVDTETTLIEAFRVADCILHQATKGISDLITLHGLINLDFADVRTVMADMGDAIMGIGTASGENRALKAAEEAIRSPLLDDTSIAGAQGLLINVTGGEGMTLHEVDQATSVIYGEAGDEANIIFGAVVDPRIKDELQVTVIATGFNKNAHLLPQASERDYDDYRGNLRELDTPAVQRKAEAQEAAFMKPAEKSFSAASAEELEVPAFLRQNAG